MTFITEEDELNQQIPESESIAFHEKKEAIFPLIRKSRLLAFLSQMHLASERNVLATDAKSLIKVIPLFDRRHNFNGQN